MKESWLAGGFRAIKVSMETCETRTTRRESFPAESRKRRAAPPVIVDSSTSSGEIELINPKGKETCVPKENKKRLRKISAPDVSDMTPPSWGDLNYRKHWTKRYGELSDVDLLVEGYSFPAHAAVLSQSPILFSALHDEDNLRISRRICLSHLFRGVTVAQFDLLLSHVYSTPARLVPSKPDVSCQLAMLAQRFGFDGVVAKVVNSLVDAEQSSFQRHLRIALNSMDPGVVKAWVRIFKQTSHEELGKEIGGFLADKFGEIFDSGEEKWSDVREMVEKDAAVWKVVSFGLFNLRKNSTHLDVKHCGELHDLS